MYNQDEIQNDTNRAYNSNNEGLDKNLMNEGNNNLEGEQGQAQFHQSFPKEQNHQSADDNSFHVDRMIDDFSRTENFNKREQEISNQIDQILQSKSGFSITSFTKNIFMLNKILLLITFAEFLFQRFDVVTLFLCIILILIESEIFSNKHFYKWLIVLIGSLLLDAFVLIDVSPVS